MDFLDSAFLVRGFVRIDDGFRTPFWCCCSNFKSWFRSGRLRVSAEVGSWVEVCCGFPIFLKIDEELERGSFFISSNFLGSVLGGLISLFGIQESPVLIF